MDLIWIVQQYIFAKFIKQFLYEFVHICIGFHFLNILGFCNLDFKTSMKVFPSIFNEFK
jgi:hypothetical protein